MMQIDRMDISERNFNKCQKEAWVKLMSKMKEKGYWGTTPNVYILLNALHEEVSELHMATREGNIMDIKDECRDVCNLACMIYDWIDQPCQN